MIHGSNSWIQTVKRINQMDGMYIFLRKCEKEKIVINWQCKLKKTFFCICIIIFKKFILNDLEKLSRKILESHCESSRCMIFTSLFPFEGNNYYYETYSSFCPDNFFETFLSNSFLKYSNTRFRIISQRKVQSHVENIHHNKVFAKERASCLYKNFTCAIRYCFNAQPHSRQLQLNTYLHDSLHDGYSHFEWIRIRKAQRGVLWRSFHCPFSLNKHYASGPPTFRSSTGFLYSTSLPFSLATGE